MRWLLGDFPAVPPSEPLDYGDVPNPCIAPQDSCPKGDGHCLSECTNALAQCYKECNKRCK